MGLETPRGKIRIIKCPVPLDLKPACDVYSLGILLWQLDSREIPFQACVQPS